MMDLNKKLLAALLPVFGLGLLTVSCQSDNDEPDDDTDYKDTEVIDIEGADFNYTDGVWSQNDLKGSGNFEIDDYIFSHIVDEAGYVYGFTPSKVSDTTEHSPLFTFPYASAFGSGSTGKNSPYLVGYWAEYLEGENCEFDQRTCRIYNEEGNTFKPESVMVCNNTYVMYTVLNGSDFTKEFGPGDYITLTAHGVHLDGTESEEIFYLVNIEDSDISKGVLMAWEKFDLRGLGECTGIYFTMDSSDKGAWGVNIPTYFCIDQLTVKE